MDQLIIKKLFEQEIEEGNIEYKRQINKMDPKKLNKFKVQMIWRMNEGKRNAGIDEAIYKIGIEDNGSLAVGLSLDKIKKSIKYFSKIVKELGAEMYSVQFEHHNPGYHATIKVRKMNETKNDEQIRIGIVGGSNQGKSTLISSLTYEMLDDGEGSSRSHIFRHHHEIKNGTTSSFKYELLGYKNNKSINYNSSFTCSWDYIVKNSTRIINLVDYPGSSKYIKTIIFGLMANRPDYNLIIISLPDLINPKNEDTYKETILYIRLCLKLNIPFAIVFNKIDKIKEFQNSVINDIFNKILPNKKIHLIDNENLNSLENILLDKLLIHIIPCFLISNVTGKNISHINTLFQKINFTATHLNQPLIRIRKESVEFMLNDIIYVKDIGTVISGKLYSGEIKIGDSLLIGPINRTFYPVSVTSIHKNHIPSKILLQNDSGSLIIQFDYKIKINKYLMMISSDQIVNFINKFKIVLQNDEFKLIDYKKDLQVMIFCRNVYDSIVIHDTMIDIDNDKMILSVSFTNNNIQLIKDNEYIILRYRKNFLYGTTQL